MRSERQLQRISTEAGQGREHASGLADKQIRHADLLARGAFLEPTALNGSNGLELFVFGNDAKGTMVLVARLDNLGIVREQFSLQGYEARAPPEETETETAGATRAADSADAPAPGHLGVSILSA